SALICRCDNGCCDVRISAIAHCIEHAQGKYTGVWRDASNADTVIYVGGDNTRYAAAMSVAILWICIVLHIIPTGQDFSLQIRMVCAYSAVDDGNDDGRCIFSEGEP